MRVLNIVSSPRGARSASIAIADAFLEACRTNHPSLEVDTLNVWDEQLPEFDSQAIGAKYKGVAGDPMNSVEAETWNRITALAQRFQRADRIVIGVPMWNFGYPYKLKQLIDLVSQRNLLFSFDGKSYGPLLRIARALVIHVRGQSQDKAAGSDSPGFTHQADYLDFWLAFIGVTDIRRIQVEHTWDALAPATIEQGKAEAVTLARNF